MLRALVVLVARAVLACASKRGVPGVSSQELARRKSEVEKLRAEIEDWRDKARAAPGPASATSEERHRPWLPSRERDALDPELAAVLRKVGTGTAEPLCTS